MSKYDPYGPCALITRSHKRIFTFAMTLLFIWAAGSAFQRYDRKCLFEKKTGLSLAMFNHVKIFGKENLDGEWVEVEGFLPLKNVPQFIKDKGFIQFDRRYTGSYLSSWSDDEAELCTLQNRFFGIPPLRYRCFPSACQNKLSPDENVYFLLYKGSGGRTGYMILEKNTGLFRGNISYGDM
jgi:hypothetical protein